MPIYEYICPDCGYETEVIQYGMEVKDCVSCGIPMERRFTSPAMIKIKGAGGYPSRRKQIRNTTSRIHPTLEHEPNRIYL